MAGRRRRRKKLSRFTVFGVIMLCIVLCGTMIYKTVELKAQSNAYEKQLVQLKEEKEKLDGEKEDLKEFKKYVKTDKYVEEIAREKLGLVYKDEVIFEPDEEK